MDAQYKEVYFNEYCIQCVHHLKKETDSPCDECLNEPVNEFSHKPVKFEKRRNKKEEHNE